MEIQLDKAEAKTRKRLEASAALARAIAEAEARGGGGRGWLWRELADPRPVKGVRVKERMKRLTNTVPATWAYQQYGPGIRTVRRRSGGGGVGGGAGGARLGGGSTLAPPCRAHAPTRPHAPPPPADRSARCSSAWTGCARRTGG
jgi:hypothetical protein